LSRRQFNRLIAGSLLSLVMPAAGRAEESVPKTDRISLPPDHRVFDSPSGRFRLEISTDDHWKTRRATGELRDQKNPAAPCWRQTLPQTQGPRHVLVTDQGLVLMIDSWINSPSPHALVLLGIDGEQRASYSIDAVIAILGVARRSVTEHARLGIWLSAAPALSADGSSVVLASSGRKLILKLANGSLTVADQSQN
jgi:hypothetical protein